MIGFPKDMRWAGFALQEIGQPQLPTWRFARDVLFEDTFTPCPGRDKGVEATNVAKINLIQVNAISTGIMFGREAVYHLCPKASERHLRDSSLSHV